MNLISIIFIIGFCVVMGMITYASLVMSSRADDSSDYEEGDSNMSETDIYKEQLKRIKKYIEDKTRKSFEVEWGMNSNRSDRLRTETVVELQVIESMIDEVVDYDDEN